MLEKLFKLSENNTTVKTELVAGLTTFLTMAYILGVNSNILGIDAKLGFTAVFFATAIASAAASIMMGLIANLPIALAPGMGLNAFFAYSVVIMSGYSGVEALAIVFIAGVVFFIISVLGIRKAIVQAIPFHLKLAIGSGIGFFIAFIGLKSAGIIVDNPATFVTLGDLKNPTVLLGVFGIIVTLVLMARNYKAAIFYGLVTTAVVGIILGLSGVANMPALPTKVVDFNLDTSLFGAFLQGFEPLFERKLIDVIILVFAFLFMDFFDTTGTLVSVCHTIGKTDKNGDIEGIDKALTADAVGTVFGAVVGTSSVTSFIESNAGASVGGKTGLTSVTTGILFALSIFFAPIIGVVTAIMVDGAFLSPVTAPALIMVGALMMSHLSDIDLTNFELGAPTFLTIIVMMLSYSIADGIAAGFLAYGLVSLAKGKWKNFSPIMIVLLAIFLLHFILK